MSEKVSDARLNELIGYLVAYVNNDCITREDADTLAALRELRALRAGVTVPREPTEKVMEAGYRAYYETKGEIGYDSQLLKRFRDVYRAMLAAAPQFGEGGTT